MNKQVHILSYLCVQDTNTENRMTTIINTLASVENWFNRKFGWFFTNGHKDRS